MKITPPHRPSTLSLVGSFTLLAALSASAATRQFDVFEPAEDEVYDWHDSSNWLGGVPGVGDDVILAGAVG